MKGKQMFENRKVIGLSGQREWALEDVLWLLQLGSHLWHDGAATMLERMRVSK